MKNKERKIYLFKSDCGKSIIERDKYIEVNGGDGTLLRAINMYRDKNKPFFGIAKGTVNFLMNKDCVISDDAKLKRFKLIKIKVFYTGYNIVGDKEAKVAEFQAFNDCMFGGDMNTWASFNVHDREKIIGEFKGGGVIICTAQGSTGINKNNGGAVLPLNSDQWYITGDKTNRRISVPVEPKRITITAESRTPLNVWIDRANHILKNVNKIEISKGESVTVIFNNYDDFKRKRRV